MHTNFAETCLTVSAKFKGFKVDDVFNDTAEAELHSAVATKKNKICMLIYSTMMYNNCLKFVSEKKETSFQLPCFFHLCKFHVTCASTM